MPAESRARALARAFLLCALACTGVLFVTPLALALANWNELSLPFATLALELGRVLGLGLVIVFVVAAALVALEPLRAVALVFALGVLCWLQSSFLVWDYGEFDGSAIDWARFSGRGWLELALWLGVGFACVLRPRLAWRRGVALGAAILGLQVLALAVSTVRQAPLAARQGQGQGQGVPAPAGGERRPDSPKQRLDAVMRFSPERNVLLVVLDSFQSDFLAEMLAEDDDAFAASLPPGLNYHRNAVSLYPSTRLSLQSMLTSQSLLDPERKLVPWQKEQMKRSLPSRLAARGWDSLLLSMAPQHISCNAVRYGYTCVRPAEVVEWLDAIASNAPGWRHAADREEVGQVLAAAAFRSLPHVLKPWVYNGGLGRLPRRYRGPVALADFDPRIARERRVDLIVLDALAERSSADAPRPTFKLLHFHGPHRPNDVGADCRYNGMPHDSKAHESEPLARRRRAAVGDARCMLDRLFVFLERLDSLGVYDGSLLFIVGDHGNANLPVDPGVAQPPLPPEAKGPGAAEEAAIRRPGRGVPLFLSKRPGERGALRVSDAPVSLCDLPRSVAEELGEAMDFGCESVFELTLTAEGEGERASPRLHYRYPATPGSDRGPTYRFVEYEVPGHSWRSDSWRRRERSR